MKRNNNGSWAYGMETFLLSIRKLNGVEGYEVFISVTNHVTEQSNKMDFESIEKFSNSLAEFVKKEKERDANSKQQRQSSIVK